MEDWLISFLYSAVTLPWEKQGYWVAWGALGAIVGEVMRYLYKRETLPTKHGVYVVFAGGCGALLCVLMEPGTKLGAFTLGMGWLAALAKMVQVESFNQVGQLMKMIGAGDVVREDQNLAGAKEVLDRTKADVVPVVDAQGQLVGVVTDGDYARALQAGKDPTATLVRDWIRQAVAVRADDRPRAAEKTARGRGVRTVVVEDQTGSPVGLLRRDHVQQALTRTLL